MTFSVIDKAYSNVLVREVYLYPHFTDKEKNSKNFK